MPTTSNFGWTTPADTDLVKDGAAAIRTLGNGIDTSLVDLKGGTTGQVLSKASNTDLDFTWVAQDDSNAIQNALLTTTGDTIYASSASTPARLGIGTTGQVLTVSGGVPVWSTLSAGGMTLLSTTTLSGTSTTISNISQDYNSLFVLAYGASWSGSGNLQVLPNAANNLFSYIRTYFDGSSTTTNGGSASTIQTGLNTNNGTNVVSLQIDNYTSTSNYKTVILYHIGANPYFAAGGLTTNSAITSLRFEQNGAASMTGGTVLLYGVK